MLWNGVEVECDHNGWLVRNHCTPNGYIMVEVNVRRNILLVCFRANGKIEWNDPEGMMLAIGHITRGQPIQPLLDWCLENTDKRTNLASADSGAWTAACDEWSRSQLEQMIEALTLTEYPDAEEAL